MGVVDNLKLESSIKRCYSTWGKTYYEEYYSNKATYPPIHREIIRGILRKHKVRYLLDAGCGPASFLRDMTKEGMELFGFDLTPEMVTEGQRILAERGVPSDRIWQGSVLKINSFRVPGRKKALKFDACLCTGVLPHIPHEQTMTVFQNLRQAVKKNGLVIVEARNQLFSFFTLNRYSYQFFMDELIRVDHLKRKSGKRLNHLLKALKEMGRQFRLDLPPIRKGKNEEPGYDEVLSLTHNPLVLKEQFIRSGFKDVEILFYHYHWLPPILASIVPEIFIKESLAMENPYDWRGYFMASAFLILGKRL